MTGTDEGAGALLWPVLLLGLAADLLFRTDALGLNVLLWLGGAVWAWWHCRRGNGETPVGTERALLIAVLALGGGALWRENPMLRFLDGLALAACAAILPLAAFPAARQSWWELPVERLVLATMQLGRRSLLGWVPAVLDANRAARDQRLGIAPTLTAVARGAIISVPALLIFGGLLGRADPAFGDFLKRLVRFDPSRLVNHSLVILGASWVAAAALGGALAGKRPALGRETTVPGAGLGRVEIGMILGPLDLLFAGFIAFQLPYLFGGAGWVGRTADVTLSAYAREGFRELLAVSALVLPLLLVLHARLRVGELPANRLYRALAAPQVVLVLVIMASAAHRMALYQREFGLTQDRFFASAFMAGLAVTFCWFGATVLRGAAERFAGGALAGWAGWLVLLHVTNPERVIVETNLARAEARRSLDVSYLTGLSSDAIPALIDRLGQVPASRRPAVVLALRGQAASLEHGWRAWHFGRARARWRIVDLH